MSSGFRGLVSTDALEKILLNFNVKVLDCTYNHPCPFENAPRIRGAQAFDIDAIADPESDMPHMLPTPEDFAAKAGALGISNNDFVIVYDRFNIAMAAARAWWMFRVFGHDHVAVLNGGLAKWMDEGRDIETGPIELPKSKRFVASFQKNLVRDFDALRENLSLRTQTVIDARDAGRFSGTTLEPRPGMQSGHIPFSKNIPYIQLIDTDGTLKPAHEIDKIFMKSRIDLDAPLTATCGSGVTACVLALGLYQLGKTDVAVYDGSWVEWSRHAELIERG